MDSRQAAAVCTAWAASARPTTVRQCEDPIIKTAAPKKPPKRTFARFKVGSHQGASKGPRISMLLSTKWTAETVAAGRRGGREDCESELLSCFRVKAVSKSEMDPVSVQGITTKSRIALFKSCRVLCTSSGEDRNQSPKSVIFAAVKPAKA